MDLTRAVKYRGFNLNNISSDTETRDMVGCEVTRATYHGVQGIGYDEKKAFADGHDGGDVWLGKRAIQLSGNLYGRTRAELFDILTDFLGRLTPTSAYDSDPSNDGFVPFDFYLPTERVSLPVDPPWSGHLPQDGPFDDPAHPGLKHVMFLARPVAMPSVDFIRDASGGKDSDALAIPWTALLEARLPWMLNYQFTEKTLTLGAGYHSSTIVNRGNRPAGFQLYLYVPYRFNGPNTGKFEVTGAGTHFYISIPVSSKVQKIRYDSYHKVLSVDGKLRMDLLHFYGSNDHGEVKPGDSTFKWKRYGTKNLKNGSYMRWRDTWA